MENNNSNNERTGKGITLGIGTQEFDDMLGEAMKANPKLDMEIIEVFNREPPESE